MNLTPLETFARRLQRLRLLVESLDLGIQAGDSFRLRIQGTDFLPVINDNETAGKGTPQNIREIHAILAFCR